jgi:hypothetical protein
MALFALTIAALPHVAFAQSDPIIGTWQLNLVKSKYSPGPSADASELPVQLPVKIREDHEPKLGSAFVAGRRTNCSQLIGLNEAYLSNGKPRFCNQERKKRRRAQKQAAGSRTSENSNRRDL